MIGSISPPGSGEALTKRRWPARAAAGEAMALERDLVSYWPFYNVGIDLNDYGPSARLLFNVDAANGGYGGSLIFNGTTAYLGTGDTLGSLNPTGSFTVTGYFRPGNPATDKILLSHTGTGLINWEVSLDWISGKMKFQILRGGILTTIISTTLLLIDRFYALRVWFDYAAGIAGIQIDNNSPDTALVSGAISQAGTGFYIGNSLVNGGKKWLGKIRSICFWSRLLNATEIGYMQTGPRYVNPNWVCFPVSPLSSGIWTPANGFPSAPAVPSDPTNISAAGASPLLVQWTINAASASHEIWRNSHDEPDFYSLIGTVAHGVDEYSDATGTADHSYRVRAIGQCDPSDFVGLAGAGFTPDDPVITNLTEAAPGFQLEWTHPGQSIYTVIDGYNVEFQLNGLGYINPFYTPFIPADSYAENAHGGIPGDTVDVRVRAYKGSLFSGWVVSSFVVS